VHRLRIKPGSNFIAIFVLRSIPQPNERKTDFSFMPCVANHSVYNSECRGYHHTIFILETIGINGADDIFCVRHRNRCRLDQPCLVQAPEIETLTLTLTLTLAGTGTGTDHRGLLI
jgi:hypothetical protein